jgi:hypothetical protein
MEVKPTSRVSVRRAGYVGALATPGVMAHHGKEIKRRNPWMMLRTWMGWHLIRELLRTSNLKEEAVVALKE